MTGRIPELTSLMCPGARLTSAICIRLFLVHDQLRADGLCGHWLLRAGHSTSALPSFSLSLVIPTWQRLTKYLCSRHREEGCI